jgi:hypothetical protein
MEQIPLDKKDITPYYIDSQKSIEIYELITNKAICIENITNSDINISQNKKLDQKEFIDYLKKINSMNTKNFQVTELSRIYCDLVNYLIEEILQNKNYFNNLKRLSLCHFLLKILSSKDEYERFNFIEAIDNAISDIVIEKDMYFQILMKIGKIPKTIFHETNKKIYETYMNIILYSDEKKFNEILDCFMNNKREIYDGYNIRLPHINFEKELISEKLKQINKILFILKKTEGFIFNERFLYFKEFKGRKDLINELNYVLREQKMKEINSLEIIPTDVAEEGIDFLLKELKEEKENKKQAIDEYNNFLEEYKKEKEENEKNNIVLTNKNEQLINKYKKLEEKSDRDIEKFGAIIKKLKKENVQIKTRKNQLSNDIASLNKEIEKKNNIICKISYRENGSKII